MSHVLTVTLNAAVDTTLTIPTLEAGASYTAHDALSLPGGKGLNVARALRTLNVSVWATGLAGGSPADFIEHGLSAEGITPRFLRTHAASRTCTAVVELERHRVTEINEPGLEVTPHEARGFLDHFVESLDDAHLVALSGSLPRGLPDDYYAQLLAHTHAAGVPAVLDTRDRALNPGLRALPFLVKPNAKEAGALLGVTIHGIEEALHAGRMIRERGARLACVTLGAAGAVLVSGVGAWWAHAEVLRPLSTVGCGDAFTAGFIAGLCGAVESGECATIEAVAERDDTVLRAFILATACGAANALMLGAGRFDPAALEPLRRSVAVKQLA